MCLQIRIGQKAQRAEEDIIVYKHVIKRDNDNGYETSFQYAHVEIGSTYTSELKFEDTDEDSINVGIHSYAHQHNAREEALGYCETLVQCTIPKGSMFYSGTFAARKSYASDTLRYDHVIETFKTQ
jgi:hypothetical protein